MLMTKRSRELTVLAIATASLALLYYDVMVKLVDAWTNDGNYSHGFLIVPLAAYFAWERRDQLLQAVWRPSSLGFLVVAGSLAVLVVGTLGSELFLTRISLLGAIGGSLLFLFGWPVIRVLAFPLGILLLMIPLPAIVFNQITFPLQLWASEFGEFVLNTARIPVLREGNVLILANTTLEVAEACSGIRSLISLLTLGIVFGYFTDPRQTVRTLIAVSTIPIAIVANGVRVAGTGIAAHYYGSAAAQGFFHEFSGWLLFLVAFALLALVQRIIIRSIPAPPISVKVEAAAA
jgi:exosortase